jgi:uncharacterized protein (TIGR02147 family)
LKRGEGQLTRPSIYRYLDYRAFLKDWFAYQKEAQPGFSLRKLAGQAGLSSGYLSSVQAGVLELSTKAMTKILPFMGLTRPEQTFFEHLVRLCTTDSPEARIAALGKMKRFVRYREHNPNEAQFFEYMTRWVHIAIRELATLPEFKADAAWIQQRLKPRVSLNEIEEAMLFLVDKGYLVINPDGTVVPPEEFLKCVGGVYRAVLTHYHAEMFTLATHSIENTQPTKRSLFGLSFPMDAKLLADAKNILDEAVEKIRDLSGEGTPDSVYHLELALFPLAEGKDT